jgi:hypothetical protein
MVYRNENIKVFVRSKRVPAAMSIVENPQWTTAGTFRVRKMVLQYDDQLDTSQLAILDYAQRVALAAGVSLEVVDLSRMNFVSRFAKSLINATPKAPTVVIPGALLTNGQESQNWERTIPNLDVRNDLAFSRPLQKG